MNWNREGPYAARKSIVADREGSGKLMAPYKDDIPLLGIWVTPITAPSAAELIVAATESSASLLIGAHNLHSVYLYHTHFDFRAFYENADLVLIDGWPILAATNLHRRKTRGIGLSHKYRVGSTEWIPLVLKRSRIKRVCVIGASFESNEKFTSRYGTGANSPIFLGIPGEPWYPAGQDEIVRKVVAFDPDLTIVGLGMPLQEELALSLKTANVPGAIATVGGAIDRLSGVQANPPTWTGRWRVEWLWRLSRDPRRLGYRYLVEPLRLFWVLRRSRGHSR